MLKLRIMTAVAAIFVWAMPLPAQELDTGDLQEALRALNSRYDEQNPVLYPDGRSLYFTRANDSLNTGGTRDRGDIWISELGPDGRWQTPRNAGAPLNDELKNVLIGFSPDGRVMFLNMEEKLPGGMTVNNGIGYSVYQAGKWTAPRRISVDYYTNRSRHQSGSVSQDGSIMLLSLDSYSSRGEEDLYVSFYENGRWTQPRNLGSDINTDGQEMTPYLAVDNTTLYFSSNGYRGSGGMDLYVSRRLDDTWRSWSKPENLGPRVNSEGMELWYYIDYRNHIAYFTSTQNSDGYADIRAVPIDREIEQEIEELAFEELLIPEVPLEEPTEEEIPIPVNVLRGSVRDSKTRQPLDAAVNIQIGEDGEVANINAFQGVFSFDLPLEATKARVSLKYPGYMGIEEIVEVARGRLDREYLLIPLEVGATIRLNNVLFDRGTAVLIDTSYAELDRLADVMTENPDLRIELAGHTDNQGDARKNLRLSQDRVEMVRSYLIQKGIASDRIQGRGYGGTRPIASNANEETRQLNRRVEFRILRN